MKRFTRILCMAHPGREHGRVLERAVDLAEMHQAELTVIDVVAPRPSGWLALEQQWTQTSIERARRTRLEAMVAPFEKRLPIRTLTVSGIPYLCVIREVLRGAHDLVIREAENPDWLDRLLGSDDMQLLRKCPCPVWVVDPAVSKRCRRIFAAVDVDRQYPAAELGTRHALNLRILGLASSIAVAESAELHVAHAWHVAPWSLAYPDMPADLVRDYARHTHEEHELALAELLREAEEAIAKEGGALPERQEHLLAGQPLREIPALSIELDIDLLVMGSVGRTGIAGLVVGNTAETILTQLERSVLVVKPPGFVTPVEVVAVD